MVGESYRFLTKYHELLPDDVLRELLLTLARIRDDAAKSITHIFQRIRVKRLVKVGRIWRYLFSPANTGPQTGMIHIGNFMDIYGVARDGRIIY